MKPDWDDLAEAYEKSKKVIIADVDCTVEDSKALCEREGVKGYPTLKVYRPGSREGEPYEGERDLKSLEKFVKTLGPQCGPKHLKKCTPEQKEALDGFMAMPTEELDAQIASVQKTLDETEAEHQQLMKSLQEQFEASNQKLEALKKESAGPLRLMKAVSGARAAPADETLTPEAAAKDEV